jgi:hypothetical protein
MQADTIQESIKLAPPVSVVGVTLAGMSLQEWVYALTIVYTLLLIAHKIFTWNHHRRAERRRIPADATDYGDGGL